MVNYGKEFVQILRKRWANEMAVKVWEHLEKIFKCNVAEVLYENEMDVALRKIFY